MQQLTVRDVRTSGDSIDILFSQGVADEKVLIDDIRQLGVDTIIEHRLKNKGWWSEQVEAAFREEAGFAINPRKRPAKMQTTPSQPEDPQMASAQGVSGSAEGQAGMGSELSSGSESGPDGGDSAPADEADQSPARDPQEGQADTVTEAPKKDAAKKSGKKK